MIAIVIVTFNSSIELLKKIFEELSKKNAIFISDNGSHNIAEIKKLIDRYDNIFLIENKENIGIAKAQNIVINKIERLKQYRFILFLDDDSFVTQDTLNKLITDYYKINKKYDRIACLSLTNTTNEKGIVSVDQAINSGMLVSVENIKKIGNFCSELFIDMVDYEWCWRARKSGYAIMLDYNCHFIHQIGRKRGRLNKDVPAPFRLYYVFRNTIYLMKTKRVIKKDKNRLYFFLIKQFIYNILFSPNKILRLRYMLKGIIDGKKENMGKLKK